MRVGNAVGDSNDRDSFPSAEIHVGSYDTLETTYGEVVQWMTDHNLVPAGESWEFYLTDPNVEPDTSKWQTKIVWPVTPATD